MIWLFFICASFLTIYVLYSIYIGYSSKYWPFVMGRVIYSGVLALTNRHSSSNNKHYHPIVKYEYTIGSRTYQSKVIGNYIGFGNDKEFAQQVVGKFPENSEMKLYFCPWFPSRSVLLPGMKQLLVHCLMLFTGITMMLGSATTLFIDNPYWFVDKLFKVIDIFT